MGGSIQTKLNSKGKEVYYAVLSFPDGKRKWIKGKTKKDAIRILGEKLGEIEQGTYKEIPKSTFGEFADLWLKSYAETNVKASTFYGYKHKIETNFRPRWKDFKLSAITTGHLQSYVAERLKSVSPKTVSNDLTVLKEMFKHAFEWGYLKNNPAEHLKRPKYVKAEIEILNPEEVNLLLAKTSNLYRTAFLTSVLTGLRAGELWGLQWGDIDWNAKQVHVRRSLWKGNFQTPKTKNSVRRVDISDHLTHELKKWKLQCPKGEMDLIFLGADGKPSSHDNVARRHFVAALRRGKLRQVSFHSLRHTNASMRILANQNIKYLSQQLGHSSIQITLDVYGHLFNDMDFNRQQVSLLEGALNSVRKSLENGLKSGLKGGSEGDSNKTSGCFYLVGDAGLEPTAFGSGDQRSIQLS
jgi:integrase